MYPLNSGCSVKKRCFFQKRGFAAAHNPSPLVRGNGAEVTVSVTSSVGRDGKSGWFRGPAPVPRLHSTDERPVQSPVHEHGPAPRWQVKIEADSESNTGCPAFPTETLSTYGVIVFIKPLKHFTELVPVFHDVGMGGKSPGNLPFFLQPHSRFRERL